MKKNFNLGLFGLKYFDSIYEVDELNLGTTNFVLQQCDSIGGISNISKNPLESVKYHNYFCGSKRAIILSELNKSSRTSLTYGKKKFKNVSINYDNIDWLHIAYIDDIENINAIDFQKINVSLDFCTETNRKAYEKYMRKAKIIFDSRERKKLYKNIKVKTPIVFHDENGCEVIINRKIVFEGHTSPIKNLNVNGAGDIFASFFLKKMYNYSLEKATLETSNEVSNYLIKK
tara:strand:- start:11559 stop:12251 length:693 start_codon:yes stop_codon:yes gene_type:complete